MKTEKVDLLVLKEAKEGNRSRKAPKTVIWRL
jgi:hypothetical protein